MVSAPSSPQGRAVLPLHSSPLSPTLLPAAAQIGVCSFCPQPRIAPAGAVPIVTVRDKPWVTSYGHSAGNIDGHRQLPAVPTPAPCPRESGGGQTLPGTHGSSSPPRAAVAKAGGRAPVPSPGSGAPRRGGRSGAAAGAPPGALTPWPGPRAGLAPERVGARVGAGPRASSTEHMICCGRFPAAWSQPRASAGDGFNCFQIR